MKAFQKDRARPASDALLAIISLFQKNDERLLVLAGTLF